MIVISLQMGQKNQDEGENKYSPSSYLVLITYLSIPHELICKVFRYYQFFKANFRYLFVESK